MIWMMIDTTTTTTTTTATGAADTAITVTSFDHVSVEAREPSLISYS